MAARPETTGCKLYKGPFPIMDFRDEKWTHQFKVYCVNEEKPNKCWIQMSPDITDMVQFKVIKYEKTMTREVKNAAWNPKVGDPCLAEYKSNLYRSVIIGNTGGGKMLVRYVDYGNQENVQLKNIIQIPKDLIEYPEGATLCILNDLRDMDKAVDRFEEVGDKDWICELNWPKYKALDGKCYPLVSLFEETNGLPFTARFGIPMLPVSDEIKKANPFVRFCPTEYQTKDENANSVYAPEPTKEQENKAVVKKREVTPVKTEMLFHEKAKQPLVESILMNTAPHSVDINGDVGVAAGDQKQRKLSTLPDKQSLETQVNALYSSLAAETHVEIPNVETVKEDPAPVEIPKVETAKEDQLPVEKAPKEPVASNMVEPKLKLNTNFAKFAEKQKYSPGMMDKMQAQAEVSKILVPTEVVKTPQSPPPAIAKEMMSVTQVMPLTQPQIPVFYLVEKSALDNAMKRKEAYKKRLQAALDKFNGTLGEMSEDLAQMNEMARNLNLMD